jgi:predicted DNA-binding transcriptional regulator AlpA
MVAEDLTLLTAEQLGKLLQISPRSVWRKKSSGELCQPIKIGGTTRWRLRDVEAWLDEGCPRSHGSEE